MKLSILTLILFSLAACGGSGEDINEVDTNAVNPASEPTQDPSVPFNRIYLKNASDQDLEPYVVQHEGKDKLVICHVPPGNPLKYKTLMISPNALHAHLNHGGKKEKSKSSGAIHRGKNSHQEKDSHKGKKCDDNDAHLESDDEDGDEEESPWAQVYIGEDYVGACGKPEPMDDVIVIDDPVFPEDGIVCEDLTGPALYQCLEEHQQAVLNL